MAGLTITKLAMLYQEGAVTINCHQLALKDPPISEGESDEASQPALQSLGWSVAIHAAAVKGQGSMHRPC